MLITFSMKSISQDGTKTTFIVQSILGFPLNSPIGTTVVWSITLICMKFYKKEPVNKTGTKTH